MSSPRASPCRGSLSQPSTARSVMNRTMSSLALAVAMTLAGGAQAQAQMSDGSKFFVSINGGVQLSDRSIASTSTFSIYDEQATVSATQPVSGSAILDFGAGYQ